MSVATWDSTDGAFTGSATVSSNPQHHTDESIDSAQVRCPAADTAVAFVMSDGENAMLRVVVPVPSWPTLLSPVHHTVPVRRTQECRVPNAGDDSDGGLTTAGEVPDEENAGDPTRNIPAMLAQTTRSALKVRRSGMTPR